MQNTQSSLKYLLNPLFAELDARDISYCVCGNYHELPEYTSNDVDFWTGDIDEFEKILFTVARDNGFIPYLYNKTGNGSNNIFCRYVDDNNIEFIKIDILNECVWFPFIPIVKEETIGEEIIRYKNFYVANPVVDAAMHFLYTLIHSGTVKEKYREDIYAVVNENRFYEIISESMGNTTALSMIERIKQKDWKYFEKNIADYKKKLLLRSFLFLKPKRLKYLYDFIRTNIDRLFRPSGLFVVFIGLDGVGKTTIIKKLSDFFRKGFLPGKLKEFYWRPYLFPPLRELISLNGAAVNDEEISEVDAQGKESNAVLSTIKFFYYFLDYIFGRKKYQAAWSRGGIVCFDRYYYDHVVYPQRFSFKFPYKIMEFMQKFIPKPDLVFFLSASPEVINKRKKEHSDSEITRQIYEYDKLLLKMPNVVKVNTDDTIDAVEMKIIKICTEYMAERQTRYAKR